MPDETNGGWNALIDDAVATRRELHAEPETAWHEHDTAQRIRARLDESSVPWRACAEVGTVATLAPGAAGRHVALRGDIDALPMQEETGLAWTSRRDGCMHACGHDGHTATLLATAAWFARHERALPGPVTLLFQPAEEGGHGARAMIDDGALDGVDVVFGWHNWPAIRFGHAVCPDGVVMAGNGTFRIVVEGRGGHSSQPEACVDPVLAGSAVVVALQQVVARRLPAQAAAVLSVTSFEAPSGPTTIPDRAMLAGSYRLADTRRRDELIAVVTQVAEETARAHGARAEVTFFPRYDATVNHAAEAERYRRALRDEFGERAIATDVLVPIMASEDFGDYLVERPGAFALIGAGDGGPVVEPCHSPRYDFNDALIERVVRVYSRLAGAPLPDHVQG